MLQVEPVTLLIGILLTVAFCTKFSAKQTQSIANNQAYAGAYSVKQSISYSFDCLTFLLSRILMLAMQFTLLIINKQYSKNTFDKITDINLRSITYQFIHSSSFSNIIFQCSNKLHIRFHSIDASVKSFSVSKNLHRC